MRDKKIRELRFITRKKMNSLFVGNFKAAFSGQGIEFEDFRLYSPGDDAKNIDWLVSAREQNIVVRRYTQEKQARMSFVYHLEDDIFFFEQKKDLCEEISLFFGELALSAGAKIGAYYISGNDISLIPPSSENYILTKILQFPTAKKKQTSLSYNTLLTLKIPKTIFCIITAHFDIDMKAFSALSQKHEVIIIHISTEFENYLSGQGVIELRDDIGKSFMIDLDDSIKKEKYIQARKKQCEAFRNKIQAFGGDIVFLDEKKNVAKEIFLLMKRRELIRL